MKTVSLYGKRRELTGSTNARQIRREGFVPCVLYGENENIHFYAFINDFKPMISTPETHLIDLNLDGEHHQAIIQETQYHPLSDNLIHVDFLVVNEKKPVKVKLPVKLTGNSEGVRQGGKLILKARRLIVKGDLKDLPQFVEVDITNFGLGKSVKVKDIPETPFEILDSPNLPLATIEAPRVAKVAATK